MVLHSSGHGCGIPTQRRHVASAAHLDCPDGFGEEAWGVEHYTDLVGDLRPGGRSSAEAAKLRLPLAPSQVWCPSRALPERCSQLQPPDAAHNKKRGRTHRRRCRPGMSWASPPAAPTRWATGTACGMRNQGTWLDSGSCLIPRHSSSRCLVRSRRCYPACACMWRPPLGQHPACSASPGRDAAVAARQLHLHIQHLHGAAMRFCGGVVVAP